MKVAFIGIKGLPAQGGAERVVEALTIRLPKYGVTPIVYCDTRYTPPTTKIQNVELIRIPTLKGKHLRQLSLNILSSIHALLFGKYDLIHLHHIEASFVLPILRIRYKVVATSHGSAYKLAKWSAFTKWLMKSLERPFIKWSSIATCVSEENANYLNKKYQGDALYIPNGVSDDFSPNFELAAKILQKHGLNEKQFYIFVASRIEPIKGAHFAIEAVNNLNGRCKLLIVGDDTQIPEYGENLRRMAGENIYFEPLISEPQVLFGLMKTAKCLIFPSTVEAMSMVLLETASLGIPVICSDIPENVSVLKDNAIYFESGNAESLKERIEWSLDHENEMQKLALEAQKMVHAIYSWDAITRRYVDIYKRLCKEK